MLMNDLIKMRIFELLSEASQEVTNDELQNAYGELLEHIRCVSRNKKFDCNLLNNRFLKKKSKTMGNDIEMSETL